MNQNHRTRKGSQIVFAGAALAVFFFTQNAAAARDKIHIVGSSTVYPFITAAAEEFGKTTDHGAPLVESTGTGGGFKLFCGGIGEKFPDIVNASRPIKDGEKKQCEENGVKSVTEVRIGFDGIVIANTKKGSKYTLTKAQVFTALAKQVPDKDGKLIDNPHKKWSDVDAALPAVKIEVYGPPATSGTRDAFAEMVMEKSCVDLPAFKTAYADSEPRKKACLLVREDGPYIEAGENDNLIVQKLEHNKNALGIFGYSFLEQNGKDIQGASIDGTVPTFEAISKGSYGISRPLFVYVKDQHLSVVPGIKAFVQELVSDKAAGAEGYLSDKGLIPLPAADLSEMQKRVSALNVASK